MAGTPQDRQIIWNSICTLARSLRGDATARWDELTKEKRDVVVTMLLMCDESIDEGSIVLDVLEKHWPPRVWDQRSDLNKHTCRGSFHEGW